MGVAAHLGIRIDEYDVKIRTFVPWYDEMLDAAADAFGAARQLGATPRVVDLGIGSGALAARCLSVRPRAKVVGIDADAGMLVSARARLGRRVTTIEGDFERASLPRCDAVIASLSLHHVSTTSRKAKLYKRCADALTPAGTLITVDCCLGSSADQRRIDHLVWRSHLERSYTRRQADAFMRAWAKEDTYVVLEDELALMRTAGFTVDVPWRRHSFAVIVARVISPQRHLV